MAPNEPRWLTATEQSVWRAYLQGVQVLTDRLERQLSEESGLSMAEYELMVRLTEHPDHVLRMSELADQVSFSRSRLSHMVSRMETASWLERRACDTDRRGTWVRLTAAGFVKLQASAPGHVEAVRSYFLDGLSSEQFAQLGAAMQQVHDHLDSLPARSAPSAEGAP